ncbi:hypothetical protein BCV02_11060 [Vibrio breoganii]|uniref:Uncharacterized protein n=1 Tax=Vibrio breoganii TaxID=553239 RepID=A0AAP8SW28_9VIBR|nr:hypothetical protein [Vibrio breoganii]PMG02563.1 hypothetical protein BCV02_11060 [Vibrio breoganii]PMO80898.1 hypothetical protein BCT00_13245 [Vibrio breoganii]PMP08997.1 hypothetical protein BCS93_13495 [Vibrio breoganii]
MSVTKRNTSPQLASPSSMDPNDVLLVKRRVPDDSFTHQEIESSALELPVLERLFVQHDLPSLLTNEADMHSAIASLEAQKQLMKLAQRLWSQWQHDERLYSAIADYVDVCVLKRPKALNDMRWHHSLPGLSLVKYHLCTAGLTSNAERNEIWERHCTLTHHRRYAEQFCCSLPHVSCHYTLSGVEWAISQIRVR